MGFAYALGEVLCEDLDVALYRGRARDGHAVLVKARKARRGSTAEYELLRREAVASRHAGADVAVTPEEIATLDGQPSLVLRDDGGMPLATVAQGPLAVASFLTHAIALTEALVKVHARHLFHGSLHPNDVLVLADGRVELIGFGHAPPDPRARARSIASWPYLSPEQTGRLGLTPDQRSDLYGLGVLFYELLAGRLPFVAKDYVGWIHAHCALMAPDLSHAAPHVPEAAARIVHKLLAKMPEARYQYADALLADLRRLERGIKDGRDAPFPLGEADTPPVLRRTTRVHGRPDEERRLEDAFDRAVRGRRAEVVLVSGPPGIGKTLLLQALARRARAHDGAVVGYARHGAYAASWGGVLVRALNDAVQHLLSTADEPPKALRARFLRALGKTVPLLALLLPSLETLLGESPTPTDVPIPNAGRRFVLALDRLREALVGSERPLVLLLDDLDDRDVGTFEVLERWIADTSVGPLLVVASYSSMRSPGDHPLRRGRARLVDAGAPISEIVVEPFDVHATSAFLADVMHGSRDDVMPLAEVVCEVSEGRPLVARAFLETLYRHGAVSFSGSSRRWTYDLDRVHTTAAGPRALETLLHDTLRTLPRGTRDALARLALHGLEVPVDEAAAAFAMPIDELLDVLGPSFRAGLVERADDELRFAHALVASSAASLLSEDDQTRAHLDIARNLAARLVMGPESRYVLAVVRHLERGRALLASVQERREAARLFLAAGMRAQRTTDEAAAFAFLKVGLELAREAGAADDDPLVFDLEIALLRTEFIVGELAAARERGHALVASGLTAIQRATVRGILAEVAALEGSIQEALRHGLAGLEALGVHLPEDPDPEETRRVMEIAARDVLDRGRAIEVLPTTVAPEAATVCDLLGSLMAPAIATSWPLVWRLAATGTERTLRLGNARSSGLTFGLVAVWLAHQGRYDEAVTLGEASYRVARDERNLACRPRASFCWVALLAYLRLPALDCARLCMHERDVATSMGDIAFAGYLERHATRLRLFAGVPLADLAREIHEAAAAEEGSVGLGRAHAQALVTCVARLRGARGERPERIRLSSPQGEANAARITRFYHWFYELVFRVVFGDVNGAVVAAREVSGLADAVTGFLDELEAHFYCGLAEAAHAWASGEHADGLRHLRVHVDRLEAVARVMPANFGARAELLRAERDRLERRPAATRSGHARAIELARSARQLQIEALACEHAADARAAAGDASGAAALLAEARVAYLEWGAAEKARSIEAEAPRARAGSIVPAPPPFAGLLDAQRAITSTLELGELNDRILTVALAQGHVRRACLLRVIGSRLVLAAARGELAEDFGVPGEVAHDVPVTICDVAHRLGRPIVVEDVEGPHRYTSDPYFAVPREGAVACFPIARGRTTTDALLFLEGSQAGVADECVTRLSYLAAQAAISRENASLYARLERENADRSRAEAQLEESRRLLTAVLDATPTIVFVKDLEGRYMMTNRRFEEIFHLERNELVGKGDASLFPRQVADAFRTTDERVLTEARAVEVDDTVAQDDGTHTYFTVKFPLRDASGRPYAICGIATDVTARREADEALRRSLSLVEAAMESTADGILVIDLEGRIVRYNRRWASMWNIPLRVLEGTDDSTALASVVDQLLDPEAFLAKVRSLYADVEATDRDTLRFKDGRVFERYSQPQRLGGRVVGRVWSFRDVTAEVRAIEERDRVLDEERRARAEAEDAVRVRDQFLSIASHELRTPLTSLGLAVDSLGSLFGPTDKTPQAARALAIASRQIRRVSTLVALLLDVSRIRSGKLVLTRSEVDLAAIVHDVAALLGDERARTGSELVVDAPEPILGRWDGARIEQVVVNLLGNALKFGRGRPITIRVAREGENAVRVTVQDEGIGIPKDVLPQIFEPFARGVSAKHYGGLGLGLYIAQTIVRGHGGELRAESREGVGTTFTMTLPLDGEEGA